MAFFAGHLRMTRKKKTVRMGARAKIEFMKHSS